MPLFSSLYNSDNVIVMAVDKGASSWTVRIWLNGTLLATATPSIINTDLNAPAGTFRLFRDNDTQKNNPNTGSKVYAAAGGYGELSQGDVDDIVSYYSAKHERAY